MENNNGIITGWVILILGIIGGVYSAVTISNDMTPKGLFGIYYTYEAPFEPHEITMIFIAVISVIAIIVGLGLLGNDKKSQ